MAFFIGEYMGVPTAITDLSTTAASNSPAGSDSIGTSLDDYLRIIQAFERQLFDTADIYSATVGGTANAITLTPTPVLTLYKAGQGVHWIASAANTTAVTLNISALGVVAVTKNGATPLVAGDIPNGALVKVIYDGTQFQLSGFLAIPPTAVTAGSYTNSSLTIEADGRVTSASSGATPFITLKRQVITSSGTYTPSTGMLYCDVEILGGGAGGGGVSSSGLNAAGGGGGGAYSRKAFLAATIGASQAVTIGGAGTAGANTGGTGGTGGASSFGSLITSVAGGLGGVGSAGGVQGIGGAGGAAGSGGDVNVQGVPGGSGSGFSGEATGGTGASAAVYGAGGVAPQSASGGSAGKVAVGYGSGGSGAAGVAGAALGGAGTAGICVITEYCSQ